VCDVLGRFVLVCTVEFVLAVTLVLACAIVSGLLEFVSSGCPHSKGIWFKRSSVSQSSSKSKCCVLVCFSAAEVAGLLLLFGLLFFRELFGVAVVKFSWLGNWEDLDDLLLLLLRGVFGFVGPNLAS